MQGEVDDGAVGVIDDEVLVAVTARADGRPEAGGDDALERGGDFLRVRAEDDAIGGFGLVGGEAEVMSPFQGVEARVLAVDGDGGR